ncbi:MAG: hypothetical protein JSW73_02045 [Candidatus Woesearchaeota archaeon]|nr:MAG: hypothetical protein JSW73_02045 [Candidatus Woesearchaeota archaeon]
MTNKKVLLIFTMFLISILLSNSVHAENETENDIVKQIEVMLRNVLDDYIEGGEKKSDDEFWDQFFTDLWRAMSVLLLFWVVFYIGLLFSMRDRLGTRKILGLAFILALAGVYGVALNDWWGAFDFLFGFALPTLVIIFVIFFIFVIIVSGIHMGSHAAGPMFASLGRTRRDAEKMFLKAEELENKEKRIIRRGQHDDLIAAKTTMELISIFKNAGEYTNKPYQLYAYLSRESGAVKARFNRLIKTLKDKEKTIKKDMKNVRKESKFFNKGKKDEYKEIKSDYKLRSRKFTHVDKEEVREIEDTIRALRTETEVLADSYKNVKQMEAMVMKAEGLFEKARNAGAGQEAITAFEKAAALLYRVYRMDTEDINYDRKITQIRGRVRSITENIKRLEEFERQRGRA